MKTEEDEAFEEVEKAQGWRQPHPNKMDVDPYTTKVRNDTIEEVARAVERFRGAFGPDTTSSFAIYIRGMKR